MDVLVQGQELLEYIPQRPPFVMVDKLYSISERKVISGFKIPSDNVLLKGNHFQESGMMENMAQTAALYAGYQAKQLGKPTPIGYIGGIKNLKIHHLPTVSENIFTHIEIINEVMNVQIARAMVKDEENREMTSCELRIFIKEEN